MVPAACRLPCITRGWKGKMKRGSQRILQLKRLEMLFDVVYGIVIWRLFMLLPRPADADFQLTTLVALFSEHRENFVVVALGLVIVIVYWIQSNTLFGNLEKTDARHTAIAIVQLFFTLFMLYAIGLGVHYGSSDDSRALESLAALLLGLTSLLGWRYAMGKGNLLLESVDREEAQAISARNLSEPLTAAITIPFAFIGSGLWELSWFFYPLLVYITRRRRDAPAA